MDKFKDNTTFTPDEIKDILEECLRIVRLQQIISPTYIDDRLEKKLVKLINSIEDVFFDKVKNCSNC